MLKTAELGGLVDSEQLVDACDTRIEAVIEQERAIEARRAEDSRFAELLAQARGSLINASGVYRRIAHKQGDGSWEVSQELIDSNSSLPAQLTQRVYKICSVEERDGEHYVWLSHPTEDRRMFESPVASLRLIPLLTTDERL
jgi:hypothetical protein